MHNNDKYRALNGRSLFKPSVMGVIPSTDDYLLTYKYLNKILSESKKFNLLTFELSKPSDHIKKEYVATILYLSETYKVYISQKSIEDLNLEDFGLANMIDENDFNTALSQTNYISVIVKFSERPLESFHLQLKVLNEIVPETCLVIDFMSFRLLSGKWLNLTANSETPPSPDYLYALHAVYDEKEEQTQYWFHTHGLIRTGITELEILNTTTGPQQMYDLLNHVVKRFLFDQPKENERFTAGFDGLDLNLKWIRREEALKDFPISILGGLHDRENDNSMHNEPSGVLFAIEDGLLISPEIYVSTLSKNPILFVSSDETERMSKLAKERYLYFLSAFKKYSNISKNTFLNRIFKQKENKPDMWSFMVKLGLMVDDAKNNTEKEHLWFSVTSIDDRSIEAKLLNQPYWISSLKEGDVKTYSIDQLTDWIIYDPDGEQYTPDSVYQLIEDEE